ncbi:MAG: hypothetical protein ACRC42_03945, partial [Mycoplasma sp.]
AKNRHPKMNYPLTPDELWKANKQESGFGIEGYEIPRKYYDFHKSVENKKRAETASSKRKPKHNWPPKEWQQKDQIVKPKRPCYWDDIERWSNSFNGLPKGGELLTRKQEILDKIKEREEAHPPPAKEYRNTRKLFWENEKQRESERERLKPFLTGENDPNANTLEEIRTKIKEEEAAKENIIQKNKKKYPKNRPQWSRCERISIVADAQYCGEQVPFYNTTNKDDEPFDKKSKTQNLFFPGIIKYKRGPLWKFAKKPFVKKRKYTDDDEDKNWEEEKDPIQLVQEQHRELMKEKEEEMIENLISREKINNTNKKAVRIFFDGDVTKSFNTVKNRGRIYPQWKIEYKFTEKYKNGPHKEFNAGIGPNHYYRTASAKQETRFKNLARNPEQATEEENQMMKWLSDRKKTDKKVYLYPTRKAVY